MSRHKLQTTSAPTNHADHSDETNSSLDRRRSPKPNGPLRLSLIATLQRSDAQARRCSMVSLRCGRAQPFHSQLQLEFDAFLHIQSRTFAGVLVGGAAVTLTGYWDRITADIDLLTPIPDAVKEASRDFAKLKGLSNNWFNNRVVSLRDLIPFGWQADLDVVFAGRALRLSAVSRLNLIKMKMFAYCDRQIDYEDLKAMKPTSEEFKAGELWILGKLQGRERTAAVIVLGALSKRLNL